MTDPKDIHRITYGYFTSGVKADRGHTFVRQNGVYVATFTSTASDVHARLFAHALADHLTNNCGTPAEVREVLS